MSGSAVALVIAFPGSALAAPPQALPANADTTEQTWQPAYDYDTDGCYPTPAIGPDGTVNGGLNPTGALHGDYDFGSADFGLKDANFNSHLSAAKPSGITFDPNA